MKVLTDFISSDFFTEERTVHIQSLKDIISNIQTIHGGYVTINKVYDPYYSASHIDYDMIIIITDNNLNMHDLAFKIRHDMVKLPNNHNYVYGYGYFSDQNDLRNNTQFYGKFFLGPSEIDIVRSIIHLMEDITDNDIPEIYYEYLDLIRV